MAYSSSALEMNLSWSVRSPAVRCNLNSRQRHLVPQKPANDARAEDSKSSGYDDLYNRLCVNAEDAAGEKWHELDEAKPPKLRSILARQ
jgi:hypothetical protein